MRNRLTKPRPHSNQHIPGFSIHQDDQVRSSSIITTSPESTTPTKIPSIVSAVPDRATPPPPHRSTLSLASEGTINSAMSRKTNGITHGKSSLPTAPSSTSLQVPTRMNSTIRPVNSHEDLRHRKSEDSSTDGTQSQLTSRTSAFSSSVNSNASMSSSASQYASPTLNGESKLSPNGGRLKHNSSVLQEGSSPTLEPPRPTVGAGRSSFEIPQRESSINATAAQPPLHMSTEPPPGGGLSLGATEAYQSNGWDATVGKAGLGKTGRVINKLVSDNEALKRDIQIERLRAEESKQAARLLEDKLERTVSDYESRLLEANVTKTLLARKERQVETLQSTVELERKRAVMAGERERTWKEEMEKARAEAKKQVEEATNHAALMEGRYNAISSHWKDQGEEVKRSMTKMKAEVADLLEQRKKDDDRIETLRELCDQQDGNIRELRQQKDDIADQFERYKAEQEDALQEIKRKAKEREEEQERMLREAKEVLDKLKWALNVKEKVEWAQ
ncbi:hypothetical protein V8F20_008007 [Naviculisporaceae sp. PSN 640]